MTRAERDFWWTVLYIFIVLFGLWGVVLAADARLDALEAFVGLDSLDAAGLP